MNKITIIDYGVGNLASLQNACKYLEIPHQVTAEQSEIHNAEKLILPGVGAFRPAMERLETTGLKAPLLDKIEQGTPLLGICLGMQLLFTTSYEGGTWTGLDVIPGEVKRFEGVHKIPHMGWNSLYDVRQEALTSGLPDDPYVYFVHSYYCMPSESQDVLARCKYGQEFCAAVHRVNVWGVQFHPEKSQEPGLQILQNFAEIN